ncbi:MAG: cold shock domain-containing protein [Piscirickettsiaceae bacterium]|nr:cold shock domain-containing protein [Piscirickettsiaceae bacterium]
MDNNIQKGQLKRWNDSKGFGFIKPASDTRDIFIHISALKGMSRRPIVGDTIYYDIQSDKDGKKRAFNARIDGVAQVQAVTPRKSSKSRKNSHWFIKLLIFLALLAIAFSIYDKKIDVKTIVIDTIDSFTKKSSNSQYTCSGKTYCSEMTSCEEATFYQNNCPGTQMDGDRDGVPCESQWCD